MWDRSCRSALFLRGQTPPPKPTTVLECMRVQRPGMHAGSVSRRWPPIPSREPESRRGPRFASGSRTQKSQWSVRPAEESHTATAEGGPRGASDSFRDWSKEEQLRGLEKHVNKFSKRRRSPWWTSWEVTW